MRVFLPYGKGRLPVDVPDDSVLISPRYAAPPVDEAAALRDALRSPIARRPLRDVVSRGARVGISVCDVTRPFPSSRVIPILLDELRGLDPRVTLFVATGSHRRCTPDELAVMFGARVMNECAVVQHDGFDRGSHVEVARLSDTGTPVLIDRGFIDQDVRITAGFIEPHFFAGFSGGPKMVAPGLASIETILDLHSAARIGSPRATWGVTRGNPVHDAVREISEHVRIDFDIEVTLDNRGRISGIFAGELAAAHDAGCEQVRRTAMVAVDRPFDVVVTSNSGYPLDQNLYQSVKGMSAAAQIVRPGGSIVLAAECSDGVPEHGGYGQLLRDASGPDAFLERLATQTHTSHDQWQVQIQAKIVRKARVFVKASGVSDEQLRGAWLEPIDDVSAFVAKAASAGARIAVIPEGPQTIAYLETATAD